MQNFEIGKMNSGSLYLILQREANWEDFADLSNEWARKLGAKAIAKPVISFDECLLEVKIGEGLFWITYDEYQNSIHLEPKLMGYDNIILALQEKLRKNT